MNHWTRPQSGQVDVADASGCHGRWKDHWFSASFRRWFPWYSPNLVVFIGREKLSSWNFRFRNNWTSIFRSIRIWQADTWTCEEKDINLSEATTLQASSTCLETLEHVASQVYGTAIWTASHDEHAEVYAGHHHQQRQITIRVMFINAKIPCLKSLDHFTIFFLSKMVQREILVQAMRFHKLTKIIDTCSVDVLDIFHLLVCIYTYNLTRCLTTTTAIQERYCHSVSLRGSGHC